MKRFRKVYLEISNICNLHCSFCPGTKRPPHRMTVEELTDLLHQLKPWTDYLYFHLMGEPLCHPELATFLRIASEMGYKVVLTTNGTLLRRNKDILLTAPGLHKLNISLHAFEANDLTIPFSDYLRDCLQFGKEAEGRVIINYRLWNQGGQNDLNDQIITQMHDYFPDEWVPMRSGIRIGHNIYLENGEKFDWPELSAEDGGEEVFCYGLKDQIGVLCDGTVVPCCLDHDGDIPLGNLHKQSLAEILEAPRAAAMIHGFSCRKAVEPLCRRCGFARRFK